MSGTLVSYFGKPGTETLFKDGIGEEETIGYAVAAPVAAIVRLSQ